MGGTVTKSGVAVDGKAAAEPANGKANGQVSASVSDAGSTKRPLAAWLARWKRSGWEPGLSSRARG